MAVNLTKNISIGLPQPVKSSRNALVELVLLIVVCGLFVWFILLPKKAEVDQKQASLVKLQTEQKQISDKSAQLTTLVKQLHDHSKDISYLDQALPLDGNPFRLQVLIEALANSVGVTVGDVTVSSKSDAPVAGNQALLSRPYGAVRTLQSLNGSAYVIGNFKQLLAFLQKLETSSRIIDVGSLTIDPGDGGNLNLRATFKAYYLAP